MTYHKNSLRLAGLYLVVIMAISFFFSVCLYNVSLGEINSGLKRVGQPNMMQGIPGYGKDLRNRLEEQRELQFELARDNVLQSLIIINVLILVGAGFLSYYLAYRTLKPIEEAHEAMARFTSDASHELRTPIAAMQTETEVSLMDPKLTLEEAKFQLSSNLEELSKLTTLTEVLLGLAQYDNSQLGKTPVKIDSVIQAALEGINPFAEQKNIKLNIPEKIEEQVLGDETLLTEALFIVLDNAVKYSEDDKLITLEVTKSNNEVQLSVIDQGRGISSTELPHVFERFYRADAARSKQDIVGYGLGLSLAQRIIGLHNGSIKVTSKIGEGSTFTIILPLTQSDSA